MRRIKKVEITEGVETFTEQDEQGNVYEFQIPVATITGVPNADFIQNDVLVTVPSAHGEGTFDQLVTSNHRETFSGYGNGANHATIASLRSFSQVLTWVWEAELEHGDLKRRN